MPLCAFVPDEGSAIAAIHETELTAERPEDISARRSFCVAHFIATRIGPQQDLVVAGPLGLAWLDYYIWVVLPGFVRSFAVASTDKECSTIELSGCFYDSSESQSCPVYRLLLLLMEYGLGRVRPEVVLDAFLVSSTAGLQVNRGSAQRLS